MKRDFISLTQGRGKLLYPDKIKQDFFNFSLKICLIHSCPKLKLQPVLSFSSFVHNSSINEHKIMKLRENTCYERLIEIYIIGSSEIFCKGIPVIFF